MKKVSVLMPVYNVKESYLREAIESILSQTFTDFEFLIVNDGSTTDVKRVILSYDDKRIQYFENPTNKGIVYTRNRLFSESRGTYAALADADDIYLPHRLQREVEFLDAHPDFMMVGSWFERIPEGRILKLPINPGIVDLFIDNPFGQSTVMLRQELFGKYGLYYDIHFPFCEDYELWSRVVRQFKTANIPDVLVQYRNHQNGVTKKHIEQLRDDEKRIKHELLSFFTNNPTLQEKLLSILTPTPPCYKHKYYLFKIFPWFTIIKKGRKTKWLLLGCIPIMYGYE